MENFNQEIDAATYAANKKSVVWWGVGGFFFHLFVVVIAYVRSPKLPLTLLPSIPKDTRAASHFEDAYVATLKLRQVKAAWIGALALAGVWLFMFLVGQNASAYPTKTHLGPLTQASGITFEEVDQKFGIGSKWTDLRKEEEWKKYKGKCVEWKGELSHLEQGWFGGLSVGFKHLPFTLTFDVLVSAPRSEKDNLMKWEKGTSYTYKATLKDYAGVILPITADWGCD